MRIHTIPIHLFGTKNVQMTLTSEGPVSGETHTLFQTKNIKLYMFFSELKLFVGQVAV